MTQFPLTVFDEYGEQIIENEAIFNALLNSYEYLSAAGGIVQNENDEILMIFRKNRWDFPKGKVEQNEMNIVAALREVAEETGVVAQIIDSNPVSTFHIYQFGTHRILKETFWFKMSAPLSQKTTPQLEEEITQVTWVPRSQVNALLQNSYTSLRDLWNRI